jgi:hypothetical protein
MWNRLVVVFLLAAGMVAFSAQDTNAPGQMNESLQTEESTATDGQSADMASDEEPGGTNTVAETNGSAIPGPDARTRRQFRRQRRPRPSSSGQNFADSSGTNGAPSALDYAAFRVVAERNIFDPNRSPRSNATASRPKAVDSFSLVGTMSYEKGAFAFFDGSSDDYKKVLKPQDSIAGYKVVSISPEAVKLMINTNIVELKVGTQMRRREDGVWEPSKESTTYASTSSSASPSNAASSGAESDVIKKMMQRREKE